MPVLLLELLLRVAGPVLPGDYQTVVLLERSDDFGRINRPNTAGWKKDLEYTTWVRINSKSLRGPEIDYVKPPDTYRILVLGDSFTLGLQVTEEQTFVSRLAERLNSGDLPPRFETINAGTSGWSTVNEYAWLTKEGYRYAPDLVLLMFYVGNDPEGNADESEEFRANAEELGLSVDRGGLPGAARKQLRDISVAYTAFETGVLIKLLSPEKSGGASNYTPKRGWEASEELLARIRDFCAALKMRLVVVGIPTNSQVYSSRRQDLPLQQIDEYLGIEHIELLRPFRARGRDTGQSLYFNHNGHWNPEGNDLAAEVVATELQGRLPLADRR